MSLTFFVCNVAIAQRSEETNKKQIIVEKLPEFPGGEESLFQYIKDNVKYPDKANRKGIEGRVVVNFIIDKDGNVTKPKVLSGIGYGCDEEALRVVAAMPKWTPGTQRGKPIAVAYNLPVRFKLLDKKKRKKKKK